MSLLNKKIVGLDISDDSIELVLSINNKLKSLARAKLKPGIVVQGEIQDETTLARILEKLFNQAKPEKIEKENIVFILPSAITYLHSVIIPKVNLIEREELIVKEVNGNIPIKPKNLIYKSKVLLSDKERERVLIIATQKNKLAVWQEFFQKNNFEIQAYDIEDLANYRGIFKHLPKKPLGLIDLGASSVNISIYDKNGPFYNCLINQAGNLITKKISQSLRIDLVQAEQEKIKADLNKIDDQVSEIIKQTLDPLYTEIDILLNYFNKKYGLEIEKIILLGGTAKLKGLAGFLSNKIRKPVELADSEYLTEQKEFKYLGAIGAANKGIFDFDKDLFFKSRQEDYQISSVKKKKVAKKIEKPVLDEIQQEEKLTVQKTKKNLTYLIFVILIGAFLIGGAFWYRNYQEQKKEIEKQKQLEELNNLPLNKQTEETKSENSKEVPMQDQNPDSKDVGKQKTVSVDAEKTSFLNVREGPGTNYSLITKIYPGKNYPQLEITEKWVKIELAEDEIGWVFKEYLIINN